jgi:signal peptidase II
LRVLYLTLGVVFLDQLSKIFIKGIEIPFLNISITGMYIGESIRVIGNFFKITYIENPGMAFGFNPGSDFKLWISIFSLLASIGLLVYLYIARKNALSLRIALGMILGGAVGNLIDRTFYGIIYKYSSVFYGKVVDFLDFDFFNFTIFGRNYERWPIFNFADAAVTIGVLILLLFYRQHRRDEEDALNEAQLAAEENIQIDSDENVNEKLDDTDVLNKGPEDDKNDKGKEVSI